MAFFESKTRVFALSYGSAFSALYLPHKIQQMNYTNKISSVCSYVTPIFFILPLTMNTCLRRSLRSITFISSRDHYEEEQFHPD